MPSSDLRTLSRVINQPNGFPLLSLGIQIITPAPQLLVAKWRQWGPTASSNVTSFINSAFLISKLSPSQRWQADFLDLPLPLGSGSIFLGEKWPPPQDKWKQPGGYIVHRHGIEQSFPNWEPLEIHGGLLGGSWKLWDKHLQGEKIDPLISGENFTLIQIVFPLEKKNSFPPAIFNFFSLSYILVVWLWGFLVCISLSLSCMDFA